jgi:hypothetical protein
VKKLLVFHIMAALLLSIAFIAGCGDATPAEPAEDSASPAVIDPSASQIIGQVSDTEAKEAATVSIDGLGSFSFIPEEVETTRPDIFKPGYFSLFDVLVHLSDKGEIDLNYNFDESLNTHVIENLNGHDYWWYSAYYDGGWTERSVSRMDHYPYKDKTTLNFVKVTEDYLTQVYRTYTDEVRRRNENDGNIIIPNVIIKGKTESFHFQNVEVTAHNLRAEIFQPGVITAIDTILSLGEDGLLSYDLQWYESIGTAGLVKSYWVDRINQDKSAGRCGFVYEAGDEHFRFFKGNHNHIPSDIRVINSPAYLEYFWICI